MKHLGFQFTPKEDFFSPELGSQYVAGLNYTVRADGVVLDGFIDHWLETGLIEPNSADLAKIEGV